MHLFCPYLDMGSRNMESGPSSCRDNRQDIEKEQKCLSRHGNVSGAESSDSSSSVNGRERGRQKEKNGEKRKEQIQGNTSFFIVYTI